MSHTGETSSVAQEASHGNFMRGVTRNLSGAWGRGLTRGLTRGFTGALGGAGWSRRISHLWGDADEEDEEEEVDEHAEPLLKS